MLAPASDFDDNDSIILTPIQWVLMSRHCPLIAPATPCHTHQLMSRVTWPEHRVLQGIVIHSIQEKKIHYHQKHDLSSY